VRTLRLVNGCRPLGPDCACDVSHLPDQSDPRRRRGSRLSDESRHPPESPSSVPYLTLTRRWDPTCCPTGKCVRRSPAPHIAEDLHAYQFHLKSFTDEYHSQGATEAHLVQALADISWRLNRVAALETNYSPSASPTRCFLDLAFHLLNRSFNLVLGARIHMSLL
jgi:hypothetical protein